MKKILFVISIGLASVHVHSMEKIENFLNSRLENKIFKFGFCAATHVVSNAMVMVSASCLPPSFHLGSVPVICMKPLLSTMVLETLIMSSLNTRLTKNDIKDIACANGLFALLLSLNKIFFIKCLQLMKA